MSLGACIPGLVDQGKLSAEQGAAATAMFDELKQDFRRQFGDQAADAMASDATLKALAAEGARRRFLAARTVATRQRMTMDLQGFNGGRGSDGNGGGPIDPAAGPAFFDGDGRASYANVEGRRKAIRARAHAMLDRILSEHSANLLGQVRNKAQLGDLVRELFGEDSGNLAARELADAWERASEMLRQRFNAAGGDVGKLDKWGLPQSHDSRLVREAGYEAWRAEIWPRLDRERMIDRRTGMPFSDPALELALKDTFEEIRTEGWASREAGGQGRGALANRRGEARFLQFKSADDWMAYAERFGQGNAFDAMMSHVDVMARDTALLEVLGPNPNATVQWLKDTLEQSAARDLAPDSKARERAFAATRSIDRLYNEITGASLRPENRRLALAFSALRSWQVAAKFGKAVLSAVTDTAFQTSTRKFNGLPAASMLRDYAKLFRPGSLEDQKLAVRRGLIAEEWSNRTAAQHRYMGEELTGEVSRRLAEGVLRASGLMRWTQSGRWAFGMEFLATLTEARGKALGELDPALQRSLGRYGISADDWDAIRAAPTIEDRGADWIDPPSLPPALGDKLLEMIHRETDFAVPVPDLRTRALINSVAPRGTLHGEIIKSAFLGKSFGISVMLMHGRRVMEMAGPQAARYTGGLVIGTTLMGALAIVLKDLAGGKDPRKANDIPFVNDKTGEFEFNPGFWGQAMLQGGGFGIAGDMLRSSTTRSGGGLAGALTGPLVDDVQAIARIPGDKNPEGALLKELRSQLPGGNLWYAQLAFDRMLGDQLQEQIDPDYRDSWRRMDRYAREQQTDFWWAPGESAPERAPDLSNFADEPRSKAQ